MQDFIQVYTALPMPFKILIWLGIGVLVISIIKKLLKLALLVTIVIVCIFAFGML